MRRDSNRGRFWTNKDLIREPGWLKQTRNRRRTNLETDLLRKFRPNIASAAAPAASANQTPFLFRPKPTDTETSIFEIEQQRVTQSNKITAGDQYSEVE